MKLNALWMSLLILTGWAAASAAVDFSGTYTYREQGTTLTLTLVGDARGDLTGSLSGSTGIAYQLEGEVLEDIAMGLCTDLRTNSSVYFEAYREGSQIEFSMVEIGADNMPDYDRSRTLIFTSDGSPKITAVPESAAAGTQVSDPRWGFGFVAPTDWISRQEASGALLGHHTVAGFILVMPHYETDGESVQSQMYEGLAEDGVMLGLVGQLGQLTSNAVAGNYAGVYGGHQVNARGIGTLSPYGGGAYIIAIASPEVFSSELSAAADAVAVALQYFPAQCPPAIDGGSARDADGGGYSGGDYYSDSSDESTWSEGYDADAAWESESSGWPGGAYENPSSSYYEYPD